MRRLALAAAVPLLAVMLAPAPVLAQGENALPMRGGSFRLSFGSDWAHYTDRFGMPSSAHPGLIDGAREPLGADFSAESLGVRQLEFLTPLQNQLRALTGLGSYELNIGRTRLVLDASVRRQPIRLAFAPSARLGFQVTVPIVRSRMSAFLAPPDTTGAGAGNVGSYSAVTLDAFRIQADTALRALAQQAASGPAALRAQAQAELAAIRPLVCGLSTLATRSATDPASPCFGGIGPAPFLPVDTSLAGDSITARLSQARTSYQTLRSQYLVQGVTLPTFDAAYALPTAPLDSVGLRTLFTNSGAFGGDSLAEVVRTGIGDIEVGGWLQLANSAGWRSQLAVTVRLPTGKMDAPGNLIDVGTGDHQTDVEIGFRNDLVLSRNLWVHAGGRYGVQMADQLTRRVTPWYLPYAGASSEAALDRNLGDYYALDVVPNWQLDDAFRFGLGWHYFHQGATTWSYADPTDEARIGLPASVLGQATSQTFMRVGAGITFSTLERYAQGRARLPYRVTWSYNATFWGRGGQTPKAGVMMVEIQAFFGNLR
jgi:hypothetical protein